MDTNAMNTAMNRKIRQMPVTQLGAALIGEEEEELVLQAIRSKNLFRYYGGDPKNPPAMVATLEKEFREMTGARFALAVTSGTGALETAMAALGIGPGDEVIVAAWSWISCFTAIVRLGARPVLAEIDETLCLAPGEITRLRTERTKAVSVVHYQGAAADLDAILAEAAEAEIPVLEDCAQSPGVSYKGRSVGTWGTVGTFSFQHNKAITSGEGGMFITDDPDLYERAVRMHDVGQYRPFHRAFHEPTLPSFSGGQFRMAEVTAAIAIAQVRKLGTIREHCRRIGGRIQAHIDKLPYFETRRIPCPEGDLKFETYLLLPTPEAATQMKKTFAEFGISSRQMTGTYSHYAREYCQTGHAHSPAASPFKQFANWPAEGYRAEDFPKTESIIHRFVAIPIGMNFTEEDADYIIEAVSEAHDRLVRGVGVKEP
jgi:8-amino-3,8-dideoxy-alpha-D-manno-octulosonate transaminase